MTRLIIRKIIELVFANFSMYINVNMEQIMLCLILKAEVQQYKIVSTYIMC